MSFSAPARAACGIATREVFRGRRDGRGKDVCPPCAAASGCTRQCSTLRLSWPAMRCLPLRTSPYPGLLIKSQGNWNDVLFRIPFCNQALALNQARTAASRRCSKKAHIGVYRLEAHGKFMAQWQSPTIKTAQLKKLLAHPPYISL